MSTRVNRRTPLLHIRSEVSLNVFKERSSQPQIVDLSIEFVLRWLRWEGEGGVVGLPSGRFCFLLV